MFNPQAFLNSAGLAKRIVQFDRGEMVFSQGDPSDHVMYIQQGRVRLCVRSNTGREAVVTVLGPADFFGEGCLAGQLVRTGSAMAMVPSTVLVIDKGKMVRLLHQQHTMSDRFIAHMLAKNLRIENDLIAQLLGSSEPRPRRTAPRHRRRKTH